MKLSDHFSLDEATYSETATRLGLNNQPSMTQLENMKYAAAQLEKLRAITGPLRINSWLRLPAVNVAVGGSKVSAHMDGWAIDVSSKLLSPYELCQEAKTIFPKYDQIIHEFGRWMHISFAPENRKQDLTIFNPEKKYKAGILTEAEYRSK
jgi:hypothetical protein